MIFNDLLERMRDYLDDANADKWSNARCRRFLTRAKDYLSNVIDQYADRAVFVSTTSTTVTTAYTTWPLPADFRKALRLERTDLTRNYDIPIVPMRQKNVYAVVGTDYPDTASVPTAIIYGTNLGFLNVDQSITVSMDYAGSVTDIAATATTGTTVYVGFPAQHEDLLALTAARDGAIAENAANFRDIQGLQNDAQLTMIHDLTRRDATGAKYVNYVVRGD